jgi:hypothetical protein
MIPIPSMTTCIMLVTLLVAILWVRDTSSFVSKQAHLHRRARSTFKSFVCWSASVNKETVSSSRLSNDGGDNRKATTTATAPSQLGSPLQALFVAAARAAISKPADTGSGAHDAVSFVFALLLSLL